jgi:hypothetical protein
MNSFTTAEIHPHTLAALGLGNIAWLRCATTSALRAKGLVEKLPKSRRYRLCSQGYSICLCFALDLEEQKRSGLHYQYSNYQVGLTHNQKASRSGAAGMPLPCLRYCGMY